MGNLTFSRNIIPGFTEFIDTSDENWNPLPQTEVRYTDTPIALSPDVVGFGHPALHPGRVAGRPDQQVTFPGSTLDNSGLTLALHRSVLCKRSDHRISVSVTGVFARNIELNLHVMNVLDVSYGSQRVHLRLDYRQQENRVQFSVPAGRSTLHSPGSGRGFLNRGLVMFVYSA